MVELLLNAGRKTGFEGYNESLVDTARENQLVVAQMRRAAAIM